MDTKHRYTFCGMVAQWERDINALGKRVARHEGQSRPWRLPFHDGDILHYELYTWVNGRREKGANVWAKPLPKSGFLVEVDADVDLWPTVAKYWNAILNESKVLGYGPEEIAVVPTFEPTALAVPSEKSSFRAPTAEAAEPYFREYNRATAQALADGLSKWYQDYEKDPDAKWSIGYIAAKASQSAARTGKYLNCFRDLGHPTVNGVSLPPDRRRSK
jgi:hypothetical protein